MQSRALVPAEWMSDRFDRAYTLNFASVARVRGALSHARLQAALRWLELRHPLLRAKIVRAGEGASFLLGAAEEIPLYVRDVSVEAQTPHLTEALVHRIWPDEGPRAELTWLRHAPDHASLVLRFQHVVSDGSSGVLALRDLLRFVSEPESAPREVVSSLGQEAYFPAQFPALRAAFLERMQTEKKPRPRACLTLSQWDNEAARAPALRVLQLDAGSAAQLHVRARELGVTLHGLLTAASCLALAQLTGAPALQRLSHPVDLRRYLREAFPEAPSIGEAVGYYVSSVVTEHEVRGDEPLGQLAADITRAVRAAKDTHEPLFATSVQGPLLVERTRELSDEAFRDFAERRVFQLTFGLSNLGPLERLGVESRLWGLTIEDFFFANSASVTMQMGGAAASFQGRISMALSCVSPLVQVPFLEAFTERTRTLLEGFARV